MAATYLSRPGHPGLCCTIGYWPFNFLKTKKPFFLQNGFLNKYGSYLLSRIVVQYHRP
jgi:hypothetical protein